MQSPILPSVAPPGLCRPHMRNLQPLGTYQEQSLGHRTQPQAEGLPCSRHSGSMRTLLKLLEQGNHPPGHCCQAGTPPGAVAGVHSLRHKVALQLLHGQACLQGSMCACQGGAI